MNPEDEPTTINDLVEEGARDLADRIIQEGFRGIKGLLWAYLATAHRRGMAAQRKQDAEVAARESAARRPGRRRAPASAR